MRRLIPCLAGSMLAALAVTPAAQAALLDSVQVAPSPAKVTLPVTVTVSGTAPAAPSKSRVESYYEPGATNCGATAGAEAARPNALYLHDAWELTGPYSVAAQFTPDYPPATYRICVYFFSDQWTYSSDPADAFAETTVTPVVPASTIGLTFTPAAPKVGDTVTVTAAGTAGLDAGLWWYAEPNAADCGPTVGDEAARLASESLGLRFPDLGPYSVQGQFAPSVAGTYRLCAYVLYGFDNDETQAPRAFATVTVPVTGAPAPVVTPPSTTPAGSSTLPALPALPAISDPTGVLKLKPAGGKATSCGAGCMSRVRTAGPFSLALKVRVKGGKVLATGTVRDTKPSAQAGKAGKVCLNSFSPKFKQNCRKVTWKAGLTTTLTGSIAKPKKVNKAARPGFTLTAFVGDLALPATSSIYLKGSRGRVVPDTNESACLASAHAHAAC